jgi:catechol 2,3-dioxygenase-like lactoylglutathione lyase family enzyme
MPQRIGTVTFLVHDQDEAIRWFTEALGFELVEDTKVPSGARWVLVSPAGGETPRLLLALAGTDAERARVGAQAGGRVLLFLETDDFARDHARMIAAGIRFREAPRREPWGTVAVFDDLYGQGWDLIQPAR